MKSSTLETSQMKVFLTYGVIDGEFAAEVAEALTGLGAKVSSFSSIARGDQYTNAVRKAIHESDAVAIPLAQAAQRKELPANVVFEIGAAAGAGRAIHVISRDASARLPFDVPHLHIPPMSRIDEVLRASAFEAAK